MFIRALTLWQPWASLVAWRLKEWETRGWPLRYEGPIAIHAAKSEPAAVAEILRGGYPGQGIPEINAALGIPFAELPRGCVLALAWAGELLTAEEAAARISDREKAFGDYRPGRWAKKLDRVVELREPIPARGGQRLWAWRPEGQAAVLALLIDDLGRPEARGSARKRREAPDG